MTSDIPASIQALDAGDPLAGFRSRFALPPGIIYLDGNSLGALPAGTASRLDAVIRQEWGDGLIRSWNSHDWIGAARRVGDKIAGLIGAKPGEVVVADSTSVNIFKLLMAALGARPGRSVILSEAGNFPTDLYVAQGVVSSMPGLSLKAVAPEGLLAAIDENVAVLLLTHVHYKTGTRHDMAAITRRAHEKGALVIWDLCHSAGAVAVDLAAVDADMAVGCGYKYLNGGPGAPAFLYVAERLQGELTSPVTGWLGHAAPFEFSGDYRPAPGIARFLSGTPPILGLAALEAGVDLQLQADPAAVEAKGLALANLFIAEVEARCGGAPALASPRDPARRGLHVSFAHPEGYAIVQALIARGMVGDFRAPDIARFGFSPLYLSFAQVWDAAAAMADVVATRAFDAPQFKTRAAVT